MKSMAGFLGVLLQYAGMFTAYASIRDILLPPPPPPPHLYPLCFRLHPIPLLFVVGTMRRTILRCARKYQAYTSG